MVRARARAAMAAAFSNWIYGRKKKCGVLISIVMVVSPIFWVEGIDFAICMCSHFQGIRFAQKPIIIQMAKRQSVCKSNSWIWRRQQPKWQKKAAISLLQMETKWCDWAPIHEAFSDTSRNSISNCYYFRLFVALPFRTWHSPLRFHYQNKQSRKYSVKCTTTTSA